MTTESRALNARPGQTWRTANGHLIRLIHGPASDAPFPLQGAYVNGRVDGCLGMTFTKTGEASRGGDRLEELVDQSK
jgi:hypothetical protein